MWALRHRSTLLDVVAIASVAVLLAGIHGRVPPGVRAEVGFAYGAPDAVSALAAAYVHASRAHLTANITGYLAASTFVYVLCLGAGQRRWFRFTWLTYLVVLPVLVSPTGALVLDRAITSRGFSGVVAGFVGFAIVAIPVVLRRVFVFPRRLASAAFNVVVVVVAGVLVWRVTGGLPPAVAAALVGGAALAVALARGATGGLGWRRLGGGALLAGAVCAGVVLFVVALFPTRTGGGTTNLLAHYLGLVYGAVVAAWGYRYWKTGAEEAR